MLKELFSTFAFRHGRKRVLILILMEHAQRVVSLASFIKSDDAVLILILMEHAQREYKDSVTYDLDNKAS